MQELYDDVWNKNALLKLTCSVSLYQLTAATTVNHSNTTSQKHALHKSAAMHTRCSAQGNDAVGDIKLSSNLARNELEESFIQWTVIEQ